MPVVHVAFYEGRSKEKKREIAERITDALVSIGGSTRSGVHVIFDNVARENWIIGGAPEFSETEAKAAE